MSRLSPAVALTVLGTLSSTAVHPMAAQVVVSEARLVESRARLQLDSGKFRESRETFAVMLQLSTTREDSAASLFGRAFAEQQTVESDSLAPALANRLIGDYRRAAQLDPSTYREDAQFNVALLFSSAGRHDSAAATYLRAARTADSLKGSLLLGAAREFRLAGQRSAAVSPARQAAAHASVSAEAQALLLDLHREMGNVSALVSLADTLQSPTAPLAKVNDALVDVMQDERWAKTSWAERCLILLARNYASLDIGPAYFAATQRPALERAASANAAAEVGPAIRALLDAYRQRDSTDIYRGHPGDFWWAKRSERDRRRAIWSTALRGLGDWYARNGTTKVAISFYESALGAPTMPVNEEWVDLEALPPLPALYATLPDTGALWDRLLRVEALSNALFQGKAAMQADNMRRLRIVRLTLGHLFAQQHRWDNGWYGAIYQLEESRRLAQRLAAERPSDPPYFPPDVYELLFAEYARRGCRSEALSVGQELVAEYGRRAASADRDRIAAAMDRLRQPAPPPSPQACKGDRIASTE